jgi:hypothetical protein
MKRSLLLLAAAAILAAAASMSPRFLAAPASSTSGREAGLVRLPPATRPGESVVYGHIASLVRRGRHFEMRLDPAWWLTGVTARRAKLEDTGSSDVPNDVYVVEEGHRLLTYVVPAAARVTVLTRGRPTARIAVSELAEIVKGRNPKHRRLLEPKAGFWVRAGFRYPSPVLSLDQQFQP